MYNSIAASNGAPKAASKDAIIWSVIPGSPIRSSKAASGWRRLSINHPAWRSAGSRSAPNVSFNSNGEQYVPKRNSHWFPIYVAWHGRQRAAALAALHPRRRAQSRVGQSDAQYGPEQEVHQQSKRPRPLGHGRGRQRSGLRYDRPEAGEREGRRLGVLPIASRK